MKKQLRTLAVSIVLALLFSGVAQGQEPASTQKPSGDQAASVTAAAKKSGAYTPLKLQFVISKYQGEKKISSLPYTMSANANGPRVLLRMGAQVPYATTQASEGKSVPSYSYRNVGISIDSNVTTIETGVFKVDVGIDDSSISSSNQVQGAPAITSVPVFRNFTISNNSVLLKDGQTAQLTTAADPISGEVMRVDVTLSVVK